MVFGGFSYNGVWLNDVHLLDTDFVTPFYPKFAHYQQQHQARGADSKSAASNGGSGSGSGVGTPVLGATSAGASYTPQQSFDMMMWYQPPISGAPSFSLCLQMSFLTCKRVIHLIKRVAHMLCVM